MKKLIVFFALLFPLTDIKASQSNKLSIISPSSYALGMAGLGFTGTICWEYLARNYNETVRIQSAGFPTTYESDLKNAQETKKKIEKEQLPALAECKRLSEQIFSEHQNSKKPKENRANLVAQLKEKADAHLVPTSNVHLNVEALKAHDQPHMMGYCGVCELPTNWRSNSPHNPNGPGTRQVCPHLNLFTSELEQNIAKEMTQIQTMLKETNASISILEQRRPIFDQINSSKKRRNIAKALSWTFAGLTVASIAAYTFTKK